MARRAPRASALLALLLRVAVASAPAEYVSLETILPTTCTSVGYHTCAVRCVVVGGGPGALGLRGGGEAPGSAGGDLDPSVGVPPSSTLENVVAYVMSADNVPPDEVSDVDPIEEVIALPPQSNSDAQNTDDLVADVDLSQPPRSMRDTSWQTHDLDAYESMLKDSPQNADIWSAYGHALLTGHNDHERAMQAYGRAIELVPSHSYALNNLGFILMKYRSDLATAEGCYRKALQAAPSDVNANVNLAVLLSGMRLCTCAHKKHAVMLRCVPAQRWLHKFDLHASPHFLTSTHPPTHAHARTHTHTHTHTSAHRQPPDYETAAECYERALAGCEHPKCASSTRSFLALTRFQWATAAPHLTSVVLPSG